MKFFDSIKQITNSYEDGKPSIELLEFLIEKHLIKEFNEFTEKTIHSFSDPNNKQNINSIWLTNPELPIIHHCSMLPIICNREHFLPVIEDIKFIINKEYKDIVLFDVFDLKSILEKLGNHNYINLKLTIHITKEYRLFSKMQENMKNKDINQKIQKI